MIQIVFVEEEELVMKNTLYFRPHLVEQFS